MKIIIKADIARTPSFEDYIEKKLESLTKFIKHFDEAGEAEIRIEISRTTRHHRKGEVFFAAADLRLPKKILRAEEYAEDFHTAIDQVKNTLRLEIEKYKKKAMGPRRTAQK